MPCSKEFIKVGDSRKHINVTYIDEQCNETLECCDVPQNYGEFCYPASLLEDTTCDQVFETVSVCRVDCLTGDTYVVEVLMTKEEAEEFFCSNCTQCNESSEPSGSDCNAVEIGFVEDYKKLN